MKVIRRFDTLSVMKISGAVYACFGLFIGALLTILFAFKVLIGGVADQQNGSLSGALALIFGGFAIVFLPIMYGILGALGGGLMSVIYNLVAHRFGDVMFEVSEAEPSPRGVPVAPAAA